jgi:HAD superfamily hydrolase (TIGR01509 family)
MKAVILDLDGVYFSGGKERFISYVSGLGVSEEMVREVYLKSDMMIKYKQGLIDGKKFWDYAINEWRLKKTRQELLNILQDGYELNPKKKEIMKILKDNSLKKIICTNNFPDRIRILDDRFGFLEEFDFKIFSYEHKMLKPGLLSLVSKIIGIENNEILYFDDSQTNIDYAKKLGMNAIFIEEPTRVLKMLKEIFNK